MDLVTVAVVQAASVAFHTPQAMLKLASYLKQAAERRAKLVVFPEAFIGGYPKWMTFGAVVGERTAEGREWFRRYYDSAIAVPGKETEEMCKLCTSLDIHCVVGVIEKDGGTLYVTSVYERELDGLFGSSNELDGRFSMFISRYCTALLLSPSQGLLGDGSMMPVCDTPIGKIGSAICWENYMPLYRTALYAKGIQIYTVPTVDARDRWPASMQHIAVEGRCFVLSACQFARRSDYPPEYPAPSGDLSADAVVIGGGSCIVDPHGNFLSPPLRGQEGILTAEIDLAECVRGKFDLDTVGHYARPDIFQLQVNEKPQRLVTYAAL